jgi:phosphoribosylamine--glycine ligase
MVSGGYPGDFEKGKVITGLDQAFSDHTMVFHAGIKAASDQLLTNGGRVAAVTSYGDSIKNAVAASVKAIERIEYDKKYFRTDIGYEFN